MELIASALGEQNPKDLSCVRLSEVALSIRAEAEALRAQFKSTGHVPYLDRMKELADRLDDQARVIGRLWEAVILYRQSHTSCISTEPQGLCNKCRFAEKALSPAEPKEGPHWRCVHCGRKSLGHEITLATVKCACGPGMGRWEAHSMTEPKEV